jgi:glycosyltransferase involved in cell wall biosynthesis
VFFVIKKGAVNILKKPRKLEKKPLSIVFLLQDLEFGGTQRYAINVLKHLDRRIFSPELWVLRGGTDMIPLVEKSDIVIRWLSRSSWVGPHSILNLLWKLLRYRPHILYTLTVVPNIWGRLLGRMAGVPAIISGYRSLLPKQYEKWLWRLSDRIICNAEILKEKMAERFDVDPSRISVIPNAVDVDLFFPRMEERTPEPTILYIGRLVRDKAPFNLLEAFRVVSEKVPPARFLIIGNGHLEKSLKSRIAALSLNSKIRMIPGTRNILPFLRKSWIFAMASDREASPNGILEAMACGLPVVATRVGGIPELLEDGSSGVLVEPGNPLQLAETIVELLENKEKREKLGIEARKRVTAANNISRMVQQTEEVILETCGKRQSASIHPAGSPLRKTDEGDIFVSEDAPGRHRERG